MKIRIRKFVFRRGDGKHLLLSQHILIVVYNLAVNDDDYGFRIYLSFQHNHIGVSTTRASHWVIIRREMRHVCTHTQCAFIVQNNDTVKSAKTRQLSYDCRWR